MNDVHTIVPAHRSVTAGLATAGLALAWAALALALTLDAGLAAHVRILAALVGALVVSAFVVGAIRLVRFRGGLLVDRREGRLGVGLTAPGDVWWLPLSRVRGVRVSRRMVGPDDDPETLWTTSVALVRGPEIVLSEGPDRDLADRVAERVADEASVHVLEPDEEPDEEPEEAAEGAVTVRIRRRAALQRLLFLFGLSGALLGGLLALQVEEHPVFAILFAPVMLLVGLVLLGTALVKRYGREQLVHRDGAWTHAWSLGPFRWGSKRIEAPTPRWRLRAEAVRGVCLELLGPRETIVVGSGATTRSDVDVEALAAVPTAFIPSRDR
ncbi:MAG: hypothetical protein ACQEXJ_11570 [Myxococcota bacterium]